MVDPVELCWGGETLFIDGLRLDTGLAVDLIAPASFMDARKFPEDFWIDENLEGFGGRVTASVFNATLILGEKPRIIQVYVVEDCPHWFLGLPILQHFDLLLRPASERDSERPYIEE